MITENTLKKYDYKTIFDYYGYIVDSQINGNSSQVRELFKELSDQQKKEFFEYLKYMELKFDYTGLF